jgi:hypothetical protein
MALLVKFIFNSPGKEVSVKSKKGIFGKIWNEWNSNPAALNPGRLPSW